MTTNGPNDPVAAVTTTAFEATDVDQACDSMSMAFAGVRTRIAPGDTDRLRLRMTRYDTGPVQFDTYASTMTVDYHAELPDYVILYRITAGATDYDDSRVAFQAGTGDLATSAPGPRFRTIARSAGIDSLSVNLALLSDVSGETTDTLKARLHCQLIDPTRARAWNATSAHVTRALVDSPNNPAAAGAPLFIDGANRILAAAMLTTILPTEEPTPEDRADARPETVRRAIAFIESSPDLPLVTRDIARAAGVTPRAVQLAFRRHLDTTPMAYLQRVRLDGARADLTATGAGDKTTVADIARRWGYLNPRAFTAQYQAAYNEPPSTTHLR